MGFLWKLSHLGRTIGVKPPQYDVQLWWRHCFAKHVLQIFGPCGQNCHPRLVSENLSLQFLQHQLTPKHPKSSTYLNSYPKYSQIISIFHLQVSCRTSDEAATCRTHDHHAVDGGAKPPHGTWAEEGWTSWNLLACLGYSLYWISISKLFRHISYVLIHIAGLFWKCFFRFSGHLKGLKSTIFLVVLFGYQKNTFKKGPQDLWTGNLIEWGIETSNMINGKKMSSPI